ncbi:MAG: DUF4386 domain-containing protein [Pseudomonadota bacterium]
MSLSRAGAIAAFVCAGTYIFGFAILGLVIAPAGAMPGATEIEPYVAFLVENRGLMSLWYLVIYVVNAIFLSALVVALSEVLRPANPGLAQVAKAFGLIWATLVFGAGMLVNVGLADVVKLYPVSPGEAVSLWRIVEMIENGIGGGNEIAGAVWALCLGLGAWMGGAFSRAWAGLSIVIGLAGLSTVIPALSEIGGAIFGLGYIVWFIWTGLGLLKA